LWGLFPTYKNLNYIYDKSKLHVHIMQPPFIILSAIYLLYVLGSDHTRNQLLKFFMYHCLHQSHKAYFSCFSINFFPIISSIMHEQVSDLDITLKRQLLFSFFGTSKSFLCLEKIDEQIMKMKEWNLICGTY